MSELLRSVLLSDLGFHHGFNLRQGGVSQGPFASFNLGRSVGDGPAAVEENHRRFAAAVGYPERALFETSQVHGGAVHRVAGEQVVSEVRLHEADALVTAAAGAAIGVRVADCVAVLLADPDSGAVAAAHAGWRGTVRGVLEAAVAELAAVGGGRPAVFAAAIFPHIRSCCFEVGQDVADTLRAASAVDPVRIVPGQLRPRVDLSAIVGAKLRALGLSEERIDDVPGCTRCEPERFFSYRGLGPQSGRHVAAIVARGGVAEP
ncbi:MAG: peptidoglycan editing factor PgeF [Myxococcales bacterium]|nr:peptidoglycan editing factor PgeF [Myxococcales bacterium]